MTEPFIHLAGVSKVYGHGRLAHPAISDATFDNWKAKYGGMTVAELEAENARLKRLYADVSLENAALKDLIQRKR